MTADCPSRQIRRRWAPALVTERVFEEGVGLVEFAGGEEEGFNEEAEDIEWTSSNPNHVNVDPSSGLRPEGIPTRF